MEVLWSPWRSKYIEHFKDEPAGGEEECFLCKAGEASEKEDSALVVARREYCLVILNKFPYNNGHLLVAPYRHVADMEGLRDEELTEMIFCVRQSIEVLKEAYKPHGFNIGINLGRTAGAGVPGHLHFHIVPRWNGDTSFMSVVSDVKVVSQAIEDSQVILSQKFRELFPDNK